MPVIAQFEEEATVGDEVVDREELSRLANWHWEMEAPEETPAEDWFWAEEELRRQRLAAGCEPEEG
ncbi:MAG TPA: hypothetical protein VMT86_18510 [Bryobacteraceae bacterium]|nr:hypothetical protein [Bryobacteraceae bacterium]